MIAARLTISMIYTIVLTVSMKPVLIDRYFREYIVNIAIVVRLISLTKLRIMLLLLLEVVGTSAVDLNQLNNTYRPLHLSNEYTYRDDEHGAMTE